MNLIPGKLYQLKTKTEGWMRAPEHGPTVVFHTDFPQGIFLIYLEETNNWQGKGPVKRSYFLWSKRKIWFEHMTHPSKYFLEIE